MSLGRRLKYGELIFGIISSITELGQDWEWVLTSVYEVMRLNAAAVKLNK